MVIPFVVFSKGENLYFLTIPYCASEKYIARGSRVEGDVLVFNVGHADC